MASPQGKCLNSPDIFCYICGEYTLPKYCYSMGDFVKKAYLAYFGMPLGDQDQNWAPIKLVTTATIHCEVLTRGEKKIHEIRCSNGVPHTIQPFG